MPNSKTVVPSDAGNPGEPIGLLLALTYAPDAFIPFDRLYVGVAGHVVIRDFDNENVTYSNVPVGMLNVKGKRVMQTGTTATNMVAYYD